MQMPPDKEFVEQLRISSRYRLSGIIEMARLTPAAREKLMRMYGDCGWPLLQQAQFSNLRDRGPWLFGARADYGVTFQHSFMDNVARVASIAVCGWIVSALQPAQLLTHLSQANIAVAADGHRYLLRWHTATALRTLDKRRDLPGVSEWLAPIQRWWFAEPTPTGTVWPSIAGADRPSSAATPPLVLDQAFCLALAGDPLSYQIAEMTKKQYTCPKLSNECHGTRLGLIQHFLAEARRQGLSRDDDLIVYVLLIARYGAAISELQDWADAVAQTRDEHSSLHDNIQARL
ncbi:DUF4123 domain-containing protein [Pseudomonas shirazensis]|uniref:DUF4123 domain-containing protein n=1 Tax=Pseudomonas shirazensis TaxID=2745494 RepID=UPI0016454D1B|nr:DUF4123 domain-containing protein [Pseudomonas shirazensis]MBV4499304.1 DUF4123 domain-containing protein [Pseudomonas shirazensis]